MAGCRCLGQESGPGAVHTYRAGGRNRHAAPESDTTIGGERQPRRMSTVRGPALARDHPRALTAVLTLVGYVVVIGTLYADVGLYPEISRGTVELLAAVITTINALTIASLLAGWYWIRSGEIRRHRLAMSTAFALILLFLVLYLLKTGGGGRKEIVAGAPLRSLYLGMLGVHVVLSVLAVPLVLYAITLGTTHTPAELAETPHARVGRLAVSAWLVSLVLGVVAYLMLAFFYGPQHIEYVTGMA